MSNPRVTIITSLYRAEPFIDGFLRDIERQTIFSECELILVNANSPTNEDAVIVPRLAPNIVYVRLGYDPGVYAVWNMGVRLSRAEYVTNANVDDRKSPEALARHAAVLDARPDVDLVYADSYVSSRPNECFEAVRGGRRWRPSTHDFSRESLYYYNPPHHAPMWRKSLHVKHGMFDEGLRSAGDFEMWLRAASGGSKMLRIPETLGVYYHNPEGLSSDARRMDQIMAENDSVRRKYPL